MSRTGWRIGAAKAFAPGLLLRAAAIGVLAGIGGVAFRLLLSGIQWIAWGSGSEMLVSALAGTSAWRILLAPALGGLAVALFFRFVLPERHPLGPADAIEGALVRHGHLPLGKSVLGTIANALSLGAGASVGREGPIVLFGGALGSWLARVLRAAPEQCPLLLACGVAACVAASFNTPAAGAVFALEVVLLGYRLSPLPALFLASVVGAMMGRAWFGAAPLFPMPDHALSYVADLPGAAGLALAGAVTAFLMMRAILLTGDAVARLPGALWLKTTLAGLFVGGIALSVPQVLGYGQEATHAAMLGLYGGGFLLAILVAKLVCTAVSLGGGFGGGVFSPALVLGTALGGAYGHGLGGLLPGVFAAPGAYAAIGAAALAAPVLGAPVSTALIVLEMTEAWPLAPAVAIAAVLATLLCRPFASRSFFTWQLARRGVDLGAAAVTSFRRRIT